MENKKNLNVKHSAIKIGVVTLISLLLLIPLSMIEGVIGEREETKGVVENEVADSYAKAQVINAPLLKSCVMTEYLQRLPLPMGEQPQRCRLAFEFGMSCPQCGTLLQTHQQERPRTIVVQE